MEKVWFDALTAAVSAHHLAKRRLSPGLVAWMMMEAARETVQISRHGISVMIKGWSGKGDAVIPDGDQGTYSLEVRLPARDDVKATRFVGQLARRNRKVEFSTAEMALDGHMKLVAWRREAMQLQIRQQFPDVILAGLDSLVGRPLSALVGHPALARPEGELVTITAFREMDGSTASRLGLAKRNDVGFDVEIDSVRVAVAPSS